MSEKPEFGFVLEYVENVDQAKRFYTDVLGLQVERTSPVFIQFNHFAIASDESLSGTRQPEVYWLVKDAETAFNDLSTKATVTVPLKQLPFGKVFGVQDPAGQTLFFVEFAQNRPSQAAE